jgi:hypothetical protein
MEELSAEFPKVHIVSIFLGSFDIETLVVRGMYSKERLTFGDRKESQKGNGTAMSTSNRIMDVSD